MGDGDHQHVLAESVRKLGVDHAGDLATRKKRARRYFEVHDYVSAFNLEEQVLADVVGWLGPDDRLTASVLADIASIWFAGWLADRRPERAIPLYELAVAELVRVAGVTDPQTLSTRNDLATAYLVAGKFRRAFAMLQPTLVDCVHVLGEGHSLTQVVRGNIANFAKLPDGWDLVAGREQDDAAMAREIASVVSEVLGLETAVGQGRVSIDIPGIGEMLSVPVCDVKRLRKSFTPMGEPALEFVMIDGDDVWPLIVLADNVLFVPEDDAAVLQSPIPVVSDSPLLTSYAEMMAHAERFAMEAESPGGMDYSEVVGTTLHLAGVPAMCLQVRCVIAGAVRCGLRPFRAMAWWQRGWAAIGTGWDLPPFPRDPVWDHLIRSAAGVALTPSMTVDPADFRAGVADLAVADFEALEPWLSVVQLDEEFVEIWKTWVRITPEGFAHLLTDRLDGAHADITLYPDGAGGAELILRDGTEFRALLQLRFDLRGLEIHIDEVRIAETARGVGLFQRLLYNTDQLAMALGLNSVHVHATGMGSYAFARAVFPQDWELYKKVHRRE